MQRAKKRGNKGQHFFSCDQNNLAVLYREYLTVTAKIHVKQHPTDSRTVGFLVLSYQMQKDMYLALLSQMKDCHEQILEK